MRGDALGLFWEDRPAPKGKGTKGKKARGPIPPIPATGWSPPTEFPNLSGAKVIGLDTETYDPELLVAGPGWGRGKGHIIGASISVADGTSWYFPIRHGFEPDGSDGWRQVLPDHEAAMNMNPENVMAFLRDTLKDQRPKVGANLIYDLGWLNWEGVDVGGRLYDVQFAEALLNSEEPHVDLDSLGSRYLGLGKTTSILYDFLSRWCGGATNDRQRANLYLSPPSLAGPYAEDDASLPIRILENQWPKMAARGVVDLFDVECRLIPLLVKMRLKGAPVDLGKAEEVYEDFGGRLLNLEAKLKSIAGLPVNPNAADSIKSAFNKLSLPHPTKVHKTSRKQVVSFDAPRLEMVGHPLTETVLEWRRLSKVRNVFMKSYIMDKHVNGRVYCSFHPLRGDKSGARSGRFSSSTPNLQNIPTRTEEGTRVREAFAVKYGGRWRAYDYSSIEYRLLVHYAVGPGSDKVRAMFKADPTLDYHQIVMDLIQEVTGILLPRTNVKNINFGIIYGMQLNALATLLKLPKPQAKQLLSDYHTAIPYAEATMELCAKEVHSTGVVRTLLNRASDFNAWAPKGYNPDRPAPMGYQAAAEKWGAYNIERQLTHKALNRKLQGSAADVMKLAMVQAYEAGIFEEDQCGIPVLTVHDELDFEDYGPLDAPCWAELKHVMENCTGDLLRVPLLVDGVHASSWAGTK